MKKTRRIISLLMALCLCMALLPATTLAAGNFSIDSNNVLTKYNGPGGHVTIPEGITGIGEVAFKNRTDVTGVTIPNSVTRIGGSAFAGCTGLTSITIPDSVTELDAYAFQGCTGLTSIIIPDTVTTMYAYVFEDCTGLTSAVIGSGIKERALFGGEFSGCTSLTSVTIKEGISSISESMFRGCASLTSIAIPDSVTTIGTAAFVNCTNLRSVDLGKGVQTIWTYAFTACPNLKDITLPASLTWLQEFSLKGKNRFDDPETELDTVRLAEGTQKIPNLSSAVASTLTELYVPASVTAVADGALDGFPNLTVYGVKGSYMEDWCALRGIPFVGSEPVIPEPAFTDVADNAYYAAPVNWAVKQQITTGTTANTFSPDDTCTVAQILTFLYRANGSPAPAAANPFSDVNSGDYYYNAARWAYEHGLVSGGRFNGSAPCTRAMVVTYLWKLAGSPAASGSRFTDVPAEYDAAVAWAVQKNITSGTSATGFSPFQTCTRGQIVTFLYRAYQ